jgi:hypothetical protein
MRVPRKMVSCIICGRTLTDPDSIKRRMGPVCAKGHYGFDFTSKRYQKLYDTSLVCQWCGGNIERVELGQFAWSWICGGVSGDGCHSDYCTNTHTPLQNKEAIEFARKFKPHRFEDYRREREFHREVANRTFAELGVRAVPPYPGPFRIHGLVTNSFLSDEEKQQLKEREDRIMEIKNEVWYEFHAKGRYGRYCQFYDPSIGHCLECGAPTKKTILEENKGLCEGCTSLNPKR